MRFAASTIDITPTRQSELGGNLSRTRWVRVAETLEANIVILWPDAEATPVAFVSLDLLYPGRLIRKALEGSLPDLPPDRLFLTASHTHQAPMTDDTKPRLGEPDQEYVDHVGTTLGVELRRLLASPSVESCELRASHGTADHTINRRRMRLLHLSRRPKLNTVVAAPNPEGPRDELVTVLTGRAESGRTLFAIWNYACHPVSFPDPSAVAANFPHVVRETLRDALENPLMPVLYFQGFSGDTRPSASVKPPSKHPVVRMLVGGRFATMTWPAYRTWAGDLSQRVLSISKQSAPLKAGSIVCRRSIHPADLFVSGAVEATTSWQSITFGSELTIVGVSAELVAEYAAPARELAGTPFVMCVGCLDHPFGYAPTESIRRKGGYEGGDYCSMFGLGHVQSNVESAMMSAFGSVLTKD